MRDRTEEQAGGKARRQRLLGRENLLLAFLLLVAVGVGLATATHYGISTDELDNVEVGGDALRAYRTELGYQDYMEHGKPLAHHGPSYFMLYAAGSRFFTNLFPQWHPADGRHLTNFLTFILGLAFFHRLAQRLLSSKAALITTLLLATQPLIYGHAFINQKDTPFWVFLLGSLVLGLAALDRVEQIGGSQIADEEGEKTPLRLAGGEWARAGGLSKVGAVALSLLSLAILADLFLLEGTLALGKQLVQAAHAGEAWPPVNALYRLVAEDANTVGVDVYLFKLIWSYWLLRPFALLASAVLIVLGARLAVPTAFHSAWSRWRPAIWRLAAAGLLLGFTISIRPIGALAGGLVGVYWLYHLRLRGWGLLPIYGIATVLATYWTWPYLWNAPLARFFEAALFTGSFSKITNYWGEIIRSDNLPWHYFPSYAGVQLTETAVLLLLLGVPVVVWKTFRGTLDRATVLTQGLWLLLPLVGLIAFDIGVYGNIRHLLFLLIPLLLLAGVGLEWLMNRLRREWLRAGLALLALAPGVLGLFRLHPYQYTYFNRFVGGVEGASGLHTLDRWCISYREAMAYVNREAEPGAVIAALYSPESANPFAREDLVTGDWFDRPPGEASYLLSCSFFLGIYDEKPGWVQVHEIRKDGALLAEIYRRAPAEGPGIEDPGGL